MESRCASCCACWFPAVRPPTSSLEASIAKASSRRISTIRPSVPRRRQRFAGGDVVARRRRPGGQHGRRLETLCRKNKIILLAPELPREAKYEEAAPQVFRCVVEDARQLMRIDPQRVYLFGNSMGGYLAYDTAMFESQYFAAVAVHAMRIADDYTWIVTRAQRKTPIAIYVGDRDQFFSAASVRKTRDLLHQAAFPVHYVELINHDHNYYRACGFPSPVPPAHRRCFSAR